MHTSKLLWGFVIVLVGTVVQCQRPRPAGRPALRDSMLAAMVRSSMSGVRDMFGNVGRGMIRTLDPDGSRAGPARARRPVRQRVAGQGTRGAPQQGRIALTEEEYEYLNNFEDDEGISFDYYDDYSAPGESNNGFLLEPIAPNLPIRNRNKNGTNRNRNKNKNNGNIRRSPISQSLASVPGPKQFNKAQIINDLIQRSGLDGPYYPHPTYVGKSLFEK